MHHEKNIVTSIQHASLNVVEPSPSLVHAVQFNAVAMILAEKIDVKSVELFEEIAHSPLLLRLPEGGVACVLRYGVTVLFNASVTEKNQLITALTPHLVRPSTSECMEISLIQVKPDAEEGPHGKYIYLNFADRVRLQLVAEVMAKGVMLNHQEQRASHDFDRMEPLAQDLADDGNFSIKSKELLKAVGSMLLSENRLTGRAEVMDKPDVLWDNGNLLGLYARLESDYELIARAAALERKLSTLKHTSQTLVDTMRYHSSHRVEVVIFLLIFVELCMATYEHIF